MHRRSRDRRLAPVDCNETRSVHVRHSHPLGAVVTLGHSFMCAAVRETLMKPVAPVEEGASSSNLAVRQWPCTALISARHVERTKVRKDPILREGDDDMTTPPPLISHVDRRRSHRSTLRASSRQLIKHQLAMNRSFLAPHPWNLELMHRDDLMKGEIAHIHT